MYHSKPSRRLTRTIICKKPGNCTTLIHVHAGHANTAAHLLHLHYQTVYTTISPTIVAQDMVVSSRTNGLQVCGKPNI